jgi:COP9 signalosome complex subunit 6
MFLDTDKSSSEQPSMVIYADKIAFTDNAVENCKQICTKTKNHLNFFSSKLNTKDSKMAESNPPPMDVDESDTKKVIATDDGVSSNGIMAAVGTAGSVTVSLHPLVIMNISEHWTRTKVQVGSPQKVYGALIGKQKGRNIEVMNSFELDFNLVGTQVVIDRDYYNIKEEQFKQVFSEMDFLGWYSTGEAPTEEDIVVHKQICEINESPLFLQMNPANGRPSDLPLSLFESVIDLVGGEARMLFVKLGYTLATEEVHIHSFKLVVFFGVYHDPLGLQAERIGLDHVARISNGSDDTQSRVSEHLLVQHSAIKMLASRVALIRDYVKAVEAGELPLNHDIIREAQALSARLPVLQADLFQPQFYTQCNDAALMTLMGSVQKSCHNLTQFINKFNILHQRNQSSGRRLRGIFF